MSPATPVFRKYPDERIRPYSLGGEAAAIQRTALSRQASGGFYPPLQGAQLIKKLKNDKIRSF